MKILAVIPARGGSKRLPRKNIFPIAGRPLIALTIEQALEANFISRTIVSTDDEEIAEISSRYGAEIIMRPQALSTDTATSESALRHVLEYLGRNEDYVPEIVVFLQCTSPIRFPGDIDRALQHFRSESGDSLVSVIPWQALTWTKTGNSAKALNFDYRNRLRHQDTAPTFLENGSIFIFKPWVLIENNNRLGGKIVLFEMNPLTCFETDTIESFKICEWILKNYLRNPI